VALRALGCREACNAWVGQVLRVVQRFFCRHPVGAAIAGPSKSRRRRCSSWRGGGIPASLCPR